MITNTLPVTFSPRPSTGLAVTDAGTTGTLWSNSSGVGTNVLVYNAGPDLAFVKLGPAGTTATVPTGTGLGAMPVPPGFFGLTLSRDANQDVVAAAICNAGETATVYFVPGNGT